ncbi:hypothetical protein DLJ49_20505 [Rhodovulum sp. 12E13]|nr:hypothetical protein DLJ49_20505 [Rhodovulum sp. 12E13]
MARPRSGRGDGCAGCGLRRSGRPEAARRSEDAGPNRLPAPPRAGAVARFLRQFKTS